MSERGPIQLISHDPEIFVFGTEDFGQSHVDLNCDVEVHLNGERWSATFFSLRNVQTLLGRWAQTGEGAYLWGPDMIIVPEVSAETIRDTVSELLESGKFQQALMPLDDDDDDLDD